jgi:hypothetical protein
VCRRRLSFHARRGDGACIVIDGASRAHGVYVVLGVLGMSGLLPLPFLCGLFIGLAATLLCAVVGAGYGYRLKIAREGITIWRTWFTIRLPGSRELAELDAPIVVDDDNDATIGRVNIAEHALPVPARDREALKEAILLAIEVAVAASIAERSGRPYRSRTQR